VNEKPCLIAVSTTDRILLHLNAVRDLLPYFYTSLYPLGSLPHLLPHSILCSNLLSLCVMRVIPPSHSS
jgi:hypothetical protein